MKCRLILLSFLICTGLLRAALDPADFAAAVDLYTQHKPLDAQKAFETLAEKNPENADIQFYLGRLALQREDAAKAVTHLEKAAALKPDDARFYHRLGDAYGLSASKAGLFSKMAFAKKCLAAYTKAVELDPANIDARVGLLEYYRQAPSMVGGGMDKAYAQAEEIKQRDPVRGRSVYAGLYATDKKFNEAFVIHEEDLKANPDNYVALYQIGRLAAVSGERVDRGIEVLKRCLTLTPGESQPGHAPVNWRLGQLLEKKNDATAARAAFEAAVKLDPNFKPAVESLKAMK